MPWSVKEAWVHELRDLILLSPKQHPGRKWSSWVKFLGQEGHSRGYWIVVLSLQNRKAGETAYTWGLNCGPWIHVWSLSPSPGVWRWWGTPFLSVLCGIPRLWGIYHFSMCALSQKALEVLLQLGLWENLKAQNSLAVSKPFPIEVKARLCIYLCIPNGSIFFCKQ